MTQEGAGTDFPARLRAARRRRGLSQARLADMAGLQPAAVSHFEAGRRAPSFENLRALCEALEIGASFLTGGHDDFVAQGPAVRRLIDRARRLTPGDVELLAEFAEFLVERRRKSRTAHLDLDGRD